MLGVSWLALFPFGRRYECWIVFCCVRVLGKSGHFWACAPYLWISGSGLASWILCKTCNFSAYSAPDLWLSGFGQAACILYFALASIRIEISQRALGLWISGFRLAALAFLN